MNFDQEWRQKMSLCDRLRDFFLASIIESFSTAWIPTPILLSPRSCEAIDFLAHWFFTSWNTTWRQVCQTFFLTCCVPAWPSRTLRFREHDRNISSPLEDNWMEHLWDGVLQYHWDVWRKRVPLLDQKYSSYQHKLLVQRRVRNLCISSRTLTWLTARRSKMSVMVCWPVPSADMEGKWSTTSHKGQKGSLAPPREEASRRLILSACMLIGTLP